MSKNAAANISLLLATIGWAAIVWAASRYTEAFSFTPEQAQQANTEHVRAVLVATCGALSLFISAWLSGHVFGAARRRALVAITLVVGPLLAAYISSVL